MFRGYPGKKLKDKPVEISTIYSRNGQPVQYVDSQYEKHQLAVHLGLTRKEEKDLFFTGQEGDHFKAVLSGNPTVLYKMQIARDGLQSYGIVASEDAKKTIMSTTKATEFRDSILVEEFKVDGKKRYLMRFAVTEDHLGFVQDHILGIRNSGQDIEMFYDGEQLHRLYRVRRTDEFLQWRRTVYEPNESAFHSLTRSFRLGKDEEVGYVVPFLTHKWIVDHSSEQSREVIQVGSGERDGIELPGTGSDKSEDTSEQGDKVARYTDSQGNMLIIAGEVMCYKGVDGTKVDLILNNDGEYEDAFGRKLTSTTDGMSFIDKDDEEKPEEQSEEKPEEKPEEKKRYIPIFIEHKKGTPVLIADNYVAGAEDWEDYDTTLDEIKEQRQEYEEKHSAGFGMSDGADFQMEDKSILAEVPAPTVQVVDGSGGVIEAVAEKIGGILKNVNDQSKPIPATVDELLKAYDVSPEQIKETVSEIEMSGGNVSVTKYGEDYFISAFGHNIGLRGTDVEFNDDGSPFKEPVEDGIFSVEDTQNKFSVIEGNSQKQEPTGQIAIPGSVPADRGLAESLGLKKDVRVKKPRVKKPVSQSPEPAPVSKKESILDMVDRKPKKNLF